MRPFITPQKTITAADEERYQREIQDRLAPVVSEQTWKLLWNMTTAHDDARTAQAYVLHHVKQPHLHSLKEATDHGMTGLFAASHVTQRLKKTVAHDRDLSLTLDMMVNSRHTKAVSRPLQRTAARFDSATATVLCWLDHEHMLVTVCELLDRIDEACGAVFYDSDDRYTTLGGEKFWLNILLLEVFTSAVEQTVIRSDTPWAWQSPMVMQQFVKNFHTVPAAQLAVLVDDLVYNPPQR